MSDTTSESKTNVSSPERIASIASGTVMLINALRGKKSLSKAIAAGFLLYRGISGNCPAYSLYNNFTQKSK